MRVLPTRGKDLDDTAKDGLQRQFPLVKKFVHAVEAVELFRPLLQVVKNGGDAGLVLRHDRPSIGDELWSASTTPRPVRPSTRMVSGEQSRT